MLVLLVAAVFLNAGSTRAQQQQPANPPAEAPAQQAPPPNHRPGFLEALGGWISGSGDAISSGLKSTQETLGTLGSEATGAARDAAGAAGEAASSVAAIPGTRIITGRGVCPVTSNGAPDCQLGAEAFCRSKGFRTGRQLDIMSGRRCSLRAWMQDGARKKHPCHMETYVTRAVCM